MFKMLQFIFCFFYECKRKSTYSVKFVNNICLTKNWNPSDDFMSSLSTCSTILTCEKHKPAEFCKTLESNTVYCTQFAILAWW